MAKGTNWRHCRGRRHYTKPVDRRLDIAHAPAEIADLARAFNHMLNRLQGPYDRLSQFSADLAHDLRTPITNLMVASQVMLSRARSLEEYQSLLASNIEEYKRLPRMTEHMLFLAAPTMNKSRCARQTWTCRANCSGSRNTSKVLRRKPM